jgi:hypothetical protein
MIIQIDLKISSYRIIIMDEIQVLKQENEELKNKIIELDERLKKYTAPARSKTYYENHKEELLEKMKKYKPTPEQIKERNKKAYLKRKEKMDNSVV